MGEELVTGERVSMESAQTDPPVGTQHGNSARWVEEWKRFMGSNAVLPVLQPEIRHPATRCQGSKVFRFQASPLGQLLIGNCERNVAG